MGLISWSDSCSARTQPQVVVDSHPPYNPLAHLRALHYLGNDRSLVGGVEGADADAHWKGHNAVLKENVGVGSASGGFQAGLQSDLGKGPPQHGHRGVGGVYLVRLVGVTNVQVDLSVRVTDACFLELIPRRIRTISRLKTKHNFCSKPNGNSKSKTSDSSYPTPGSLFKNTLQGILIATLEEGMGPRVLSLRNFHLVNMLLLLWKCLRPPLIGGELIGSQRSLDQKEQKS